MYLFCCAPADLDLEVAYATPLANKISLDEIKIIQKWPGRKSEKIPSTISYSRSTGRERQWGYDISPDSVVMISTKLELDSSDSTEELELLLQALEGMNNLNFQANKTVDSSLSPFSRSPEDIVRDYMRALLQEVLQILDDEIGRIRTTLPTDVVLTFPLVGE